ncbi:MAG: amino acid adenylation domain-containing protein [Burkholderiales bacterium]|nr:amino acid adenylation domain-containing protein [Burkholderiales bacterium]
MNMTQQDIQAVLARIRSLPPKQQQALVRMLKQQGVDISSAQAIGRRPASQEPAPLSFAQQRLWFLAQLEGHSAHYNIPMALRLAGRLDRPALVHALSAIVERHEALRPRFVEVDGVPYQRTEPAVNFAVQEETLPEGTDLRALCEDEALRPFDLGAGSLVRMRLVACGPEEHVLLVTMHHSVSDGWSLGVFFRELVSLYGAFSRGEPSPLQPLPIQYADYAHWQREWLSGQVQERQIEYWKQKLAGVDPQLMLPTDRPRPPVKTYTGAHEPLQCSAALLEGLKALGRAHESTLYMTLLSVWAVLLHRYSRQTDIAIGTPLANRNRPEVENLIGFFVNTQVMRADLDGQPSFAQLLARMKRTALEAYGHQDVPFEAVVDALQLERSLSHSPVFQVMFALQEAQAERSHRLADLEVSFVDFDYKITKFDLTLDLRETPDGLAGSIEYNCDLFDRATVQRMIRHYVALLEAVVAEPQAPVSRLVWLGPQEREQVVRTWNPCADHAPAQGMHELFEAQVARTPDAVAVSCDGAQLSYAELNRRANRVAHALRGLGVKPDTLVALCVERSLEMVVGLLGIVKAGGAYVPVDPAYPAQRIRYILEDSGAGLLLTQAALAPRLPLATQRVVLLDGTGQGGEDLLAGQPETDIPVAESGLRPSNLLYVIYTSGSTGHPKGVLVQHDNVARLFHATEATFRFGASDTWTLFHSFSFDFSVWELWGALLHGGRLVVVPKTVAQSPSEFYRLLVDERVTVLNQTPSAFEQLVAVDQAERGRLSLRTVVFGGEALNPAILAPWFERHGESIDMVNMYGITETTVHVTCKLLSAGDAAGQRSIVGRKLPDLRLYVLDEHMEPLPVGVTGEMYVGGAGVARGYLNRPELTAQRFVDDPFAAQPGERLYRTGDLARWLPDGNLEFIGRADHQVKIRGFRIETGEIESQLAQSPQVQSCVVLVREDRPGQKQLVAYVVPREPLQDDLHQALGRHLRERLPDYMVPTAFVVMQAFPLTSNGKLDRSALPAPDKTAYAADEYVTPATEAERVLATLWAELLGFEPGRISARDNFFALGGHSLLITVLVARLKEKGYDATVRSVFGSDTLADLASQIEQGASSEAYVVPPHRVPAGCERLTPDMLTLVTLDQRELDAVAGTVPDGAANVQDIYPLVPSQQGILFHHLIDPDNDPYIIPVLLAADGPVACDAFVNALRRLLARHDVMRTAVVTSGLLEPVQVVYRQAELPIEHLVLEPGRDAMAQAQALLERPRRMPLDRAPLLQLTIAADPASQRRFILLNVHHLIEDASSLRLIFAELRASMAGRLEQIGPVPVPYRDFVAHTLHQVRTNDAEGFFRRRLAEVSEPTIPFRLANVHGDGRTIRDLRRSLPAALDASIRRQAQRLRISPASLFHAAWSLVVAGASGRDDVVFGTVLSGRLQGVPGVERMLGNFINTLPLRVVLKDRSALQLVLDTDAALKELIEYEQSSLIMAQRCSGLGSDVPLFTSMINVRHFEGGEGEPLQESGVRVLGSVDRTNYPLGVSVDDLGTAFSVNVQVDEAVSTETVTGSFQAALQGLADALQEGRAEALPALSIDVVPADERRRQLVDWNRTDTPYPADQVLPGLFDEQVLRSPDAIALVFGTQQLSYAQLNARANKVAHFLHEAGVRPDTVVGLCMERSVDMVAGLLGILKAGGAYLPIDPAYPRERIAGMLQDSGISLLLSQTRVALTLPDFDGEVIHLDAGVRASDGAKVLVNQPGHDLPREHVGLQPHHLAYVIFTSGSTGRPKGVMVEQRGVVRLVRNPDYCPSGAHTVMLQHSSISFDVGSQEVLGPLLNGGRLVLHQGETKDIVQLLDHVERHEVNMMCLSAAFLPAFVQEAAHRRLPLQCLCVGGEAFSARDVLALYERHPGLSVVNGYGPTENSIASTCHVIPQDIAPDAPIPIGRPIAQSTAYVVNRRMRLLPCGAVGELCVGGVGVARGYLGHPELTRERFVPSPFEGSEGQRLYRTGDLVRWRPDGLLEFVGRVDDQVKVRGFRIELGEIESALQAHPDLRSAVVATEAAQGSDSKRLVAYICPNEDYLERAAQTLRPDSLERWNELFEDEYARGRHDDAAPGDLNLVGWNSSYTGEAIPQAQMEEWVDGAVQRIRALRPRRVLEIGCGSGLLLLRYAGECESVHASDISAAALAGVQRELSRRRWDHVSLSQGDALDFSALAGRTFDTVVINSVVQYYPSRAYLEQALQGLWPYIEEGGRIFIGDVRNADLMSAHLCAVERSRMVGGVPAATLAGRLYRRRMQEGELLVSPSFFMHLARRLAGAGRTDILLKRGLGDNEMLSYRYDVVLAKGAAQPAPALAWLPASSPDDVRQLLERGAPERFGVHGLRNPRIREDVAAADVPGRAPAGQRVDPLGPSRWSEQARQEVEAFDALIEHAAARGYRCEATWSQDVPDGVDLLFGRSELPAVQARSPYAQTYWTNHPQIARLGQELSRGVKQHLSRTLAEYMVPNIFVVLEALPLTPNGKVDKRALPAPEEEDVQKEAYAAPRNGEEQALCRMLQEILGLQRVGIRDDFFELGGHSLLATRLTARVRQELGKDLPLKAVFDGRTVERIAALVQQEKAEAQTVLPRRVAADSGALAPISFYQEEDLWFLRRRPHLALGHDNVQLVFRLIGELDLDAYARSCQLLVERHGVLRTSFVEKDGVAWQKVNPAEGFQAGIERMPDENALEEFLKAEKARPFEPAGPFTVRIHLLVFSDLERVVVVTRPWGIFDGYSTPVVLFPDLSAIYAAISLGRVPQLPPPPLQYVDFAHWQRETFTPEVLQPKIDYWTQRLAGAPRDLRLKTDYRRPLVLSGKGAAVHFLVPPKFIKKLKDFGRQHDFSLYVVMLSAYAILLADYTDETDMLIGSPISNRSRPELEQMMGHFVNVLVMRADVSQGQRYIDVLSRMKVTAQEGLNHADVPLRCVVQSLSLPTLPGQASLFHVMFNLVTLPEDFSNRYNNQAIVHYRPESETAKLDLNMAMQDTNMGLAASIEYSIDLFARTTIEKMAARYRQVLADMVANPLALLSERSDLAVALEEGDEKPAA